MLSYLYIRYCNIPGWLGPRFIQPIRLMASAGLFYFYYCLGRCLLYPLSYLGMQNIERPKHGVVEKQLKRGILFGSQGGSSNRWNPGLSSNLIDLDKKLSSLFTILLRYRHGIKYRPIPVYIGRYELISAHTGPIFW